MCVGAGVGDIVAEWDNNSFWLLVTKRLSLISINDRLCCYAFFVFSCCHEERRVFVSFS